MCLFYRDSMINYDENENVDHLDATKIDLNIGTNILKILNIQNIKCRKCFSMMLLKLLSSIHEKVK